MSDEKPTDKPIEKLPEHLRDLIARSMADIALIDLPQARYLVATELDPMPGLDDADAREGLRLVTLSAGDVSAGAAPPPTLEGAPPAGGHILLTSGTTGLYKKVLIPHSAEAGLNALVARKP